MRLPASATFPRRLPRPGLAALLLLFIALAVLLLTAGPAQAQTPVKLVGNTGKDTSTTTFATHDVAQGFNTGSQPTGYTLTEVQLDLTITGSSLPSYEVEIWTANSTGQPDSKLGTLTKPSALTTGLNSFTSASGIGLDRSTNYLVVIDLSSASEHWGIRHTTSGAEDPGRASGWGIADSSLSRTRDSAGSYGSNAAAVKMAVRGSVNSSLKLVGNTGQTTDSTTTSDSHDVAQAFTTGPLPTGYTLTEVQLDLAITGSGLPSYEVEIWNATGAKLGTLTKPSALTDGLNSFTSASGIRLERDTTYWVVIDLSSAGEHWGVRYTASNGEDPDGASGWGIGNSSVYRTRGGTGTSAWSSVAFAVKMAVRGYLYSTMVNGETLTMLFPFPLDPCCVPAVGAFTVTSSYGGRQIPVSAVSISGSSLTLTLQEPISSHVSRAWVRYDPREAGSRLRSTHIIIPEPEYYAGVDRSQFPYFVREVAVVSLDTPPVVRELTVRHSTRPENQPTVVSGIHRVEDLPPVERWSVLWVRLNEPVDAGSLPAGSAFTVTARPPGGGSAVTVSGTGTVSGDGSSEIAVTLAEPVARDAVVTVSYVKPSANPLRDLTGNELELESFSGVAATNVDRGMAVPEVVSVAVVSDPGSDRTYRWGDKIQVQVTFSGDVLVSGTPRLRFSMAQSHPSASPDRGGSFYPYAEYESGSGTRTLTFAYTVKELDSSFGIAVQDRLELNGGSISSWAFPGLPKTNPDLSFPDWTESHDFDHKVDGALLVFQSAAVDGTTLTMTFGATVGSLSLDTGSVPAPGDFHVTVGDARRNVASGGVAISDTTVTLTLASAVTAGDEVKVRYTKTTNPSANQLQDTHGSPVDTFGDQSVTNTAGEAIWSSSLTLVAWGNLEGCDDRHGSGPCTTGLTENTFEFDGVQYRVTRAQNGRSASTQPTAVLIALNKAWPTLLRDAAALHFGSTQLSLASASYSDQETTAHWAAGPDAYVPAGQTISLRLIVPPGTSSEEGGATGASDPPGDLTVSPGTSSDAGGATGASDPPGGATGVGAHVSIAATPASPRVGEAVNLTAAITDAPARSSPSYNWEIETGGEWSSFGTNSTLSFLAGKPESWTFRVTVSYDTGESATSVPLKVVWSKEAQTQPEGGPVGTSDDDATPQAPAVTAVEVTSSPSSGDTYGKDEVIRISVTFDQAVDVTGTPHLTIDMDPAEWGAKQAAYESGGGTATLVFAHTVVEPNISTQGIAVLANTLALNGGDIESTASDTDADLSHDGLAHDANHKVDWEEESESSPPANTPATGAPAITGTARVGETLTAGTSGISDGDGLTGATFSYQWLADGAAISGATGSTYAPATADVGKALSVRVSFTDDAGHSETLTSAATAEVAAKPPEVTAVAVTSDPASGDTYGKDEVIRISVTFDEAVDVTGTPHLTIDMDPAEWGAKQAAYESGSGTATLVFAHTVVEPNISTQGIAVLANTLALNGGDIESKATDTDADLSHDGLAHDSGHKVDWEEESESSPPANNPATGAPAITGTAREGETLTADTSGIADADGLGNASFSYQWQADGADLSGATGSTYTLGRADRGKAVRVRVSFTDDAGHAETLTSAATAEVAAKPPEVTAVAVTSDPASGDTYGKDEVIRISVTFDEAVDVTGSPQLTIDMDPAEWGAKQAAYESGGGTATLVFAHTVVEPNISTQGIAVLANTLALNGGDIESKATDTDADLSHDGLAHDADHKVDWQLSNDGGPGS